MFSDKKEDESISNYISNDLNFTDSSTYTYSTVTQASNENLGKAFLIVKMLIDKKIIKSNDKFVELVDKISKLI